MQTLLTPAGADPITHRTQCDNPAACIARGAGHCRFCRVAPLGPTSARRVPSKPGGAS